MLVVNVVLHRHDIGAGGLMLKLALKVAAIVASGSAGYVAGTTADGPAVVYVELDKRDSVAVETFLAHKACAHYERERGLERGTCDAKKIQGAALVKVLTDAELAARLGAAAKRYCLENLSWPAFVRSLGQTYEAIRGTDS